MWPFASVICIQNKTSRIKQSQKHDANKKFMLHSYIQKTAENTAKSPV